MTAPLILFLDISKTNTGASFGRVGDKPAFASIRGSDMDETAAMMKLGLWLIDWIRVSKPDRIYFEAAIDRVISSAHTTIVLAKMVAVVEFIAGMKGVMARPGNVRTIRKAFLGTGLPSDPKRHAKAMCSDLGWEPKNLDEADAAAGWYWASIQTAPNLAQIVTPMQQAKVASLMESGIALAGGRS